jgi:uncharacterized protein YtpQ (UPF0354 family)
MSPSEFTSEFASAMRKADSSLQVEVVAELELKITPSNGNARTSFLNNAYDTYKQDPEAKDDLIARFVTVGLAVDNDVDFHRTRIVPIVKDRPWIEEVQQASLKAKGSKPLSLVFEDLNEELVVIYALDSPTNIRYLTPDDLQREGLEVTHLRTLACDNLRKLLPELKRHGDNGFYMFTADGSYEASLILFEKLWTDKELKVDGEVVIAIPARDVLIVTGSNNAPGLTRMRQTVEKIAAEAPYRLTTKLFIHRNGRFACWTK